MIDYGILDHSVRWYESQGFTRIESPWAVSKKTHYITKPDYASDTDYELKHNGKLLVASGEQSFLYLFLKGFLPHGCYQTITPCFRYETFDFLHSKYFIKNELIDTENVNAERLKEIANKCLLFFQMYIPDAAIVEISTGNEDETTYDIQYGEYELGSYGIRRCEFLHWIYATGAAEPRLSNLMKLSKEVDKWDTTKKKSFLENWGRLPK